MGGDTVLVAGAGGYLGRALVLELLRRGIEVRALVHRTGTVAAELAAAGADVTAVVLTHPGALVGICDGCMAVASCMAAGMSGSPEAVDRDANIALFQEAAATAARAAAGSGGSGGNSGNGRSGSGRGQDKRSSAGSASASGGGGVRRFLLVATFEGRDARASVPMQEAKEAAVDFVESLAGEHGISYTILRPTAYFKDFTDMPWKWLKRHNWMVAPGGGRTHYNPVDGAELASFMADCLLEPSAGQWADKEVPIGGPQVVTFRETIYAAAEALGKRRDQIWVITLPVLLLRAAAVVAGMLGMLWQPAARLAGGLKFAIYSATHDSVGMRWGSLTVADHYRRLREQMDQQQREASAGAGKEE